MNSDQLAGILRAVLPAVVAFAVAKGWVGAGSADWLVASVVSIVCAGWSAWTNKPGTVIPK
jgi:hypothetical protein